MTWEDNFFKESVHIESLNNVIVIFTPQMRFLDLFNQYILLIAI